MVIHHSVRFYLICFALLIHEFFSTFSSDRIYDFNGIFMCISSVIKWFTAFRFFLYCCHKLLSLKRMSLSCKCLLSEIIFVITGVIQGLLQCFSASVPFTWWRHQMETFSVLLVLCVGNSPVTGEFTAQRPETRSFDVFFDVCRNKRLNKQWWGWWFETPWRPLWRHCNEQKRRVYHWLFRTLVLTFPSPY